MKKPFLIIALGFVLILPIVFSACAGSVNTLSNKKIMNIALVLGSGGLGDRSFNDSAYSGLLEAQKHNSNLRFELIDSTDETAKLDSVRLFATSSYDLIIGVGFENNSVISAMAKEYLRIKFGAIDFELSAPNVASFVYREQEADFVMGVLAANLTKTGKVGVIGGTDIPAIRRIMSGYQKGVTFQNPGVIVFSDFAGTFSDPDLGYKLALSRYEQGVDIIHNAASRTGLGIIEAAKQAGKYTTGTSGDQRYLAPDNVIGNRPKRVDTAISLLIEDVKDGTFKPGVHSLGLKEEGFVFGPFNDKLVTPDVQNRLNLLKTQIIQGTIRIPEG